MSKGSEWRKWDLHFHTPSSYDYEDGATTNEQIVDGLVQNGISVIAITDHHVIDVARIQDLQAIGKAKGVTVLPGIEFLSDAKGNEPVHFIGIFSELSNLEYIWAQLENKTALAKIKGEGKKHNEVYCHLADTITLIKELGGIVSIHAGKKSNSLENITHALPHGTAQKEDIAQAIDIFEVGKENDCEEYKKTVIPYIQTKFGKHIPVIICSDNHRIGTYTLKQNLWIKGEPTFEGLKQIKYEPDQRVKIQLEKPDYKEDRLLISEVQFTSSDNRFTPHPIQFNENLNVIIGGKSSGKSILLYNIARTLLADRGFFAREGIDTKYRFEKEDPKFDFKVKTKGGFEQSIRRGDEEPSVIPEVKYIPQSYLIKLAEPEQNKSGATLNKIIRDLINEDVESKRSYEAFITAVKANDKKRENIIDTYFEIKNRIIDLEGQLKLKPKEEILQSNIATNTAKVEELNKSAGMTPEDIAKYNHLQKELEEIESNRNIAVDDFKKVEKYNLEVSDFLNSLKIKQALLVNSLRNTILKGLYDESTSEIDALLDTFNGISSKIEIVPTGTGRAFKIKSEVSQVFSDLNSQRKVIDEQLQPYLKNEILKKQIEDISKSITDDKASLQAIAQLTKEIGDSKKALNDEKNKLFSLYEANIQEYNSVIEHLKVRTNDLEKDGLKISGLVKFNFPKFRKHFLPTNDGRKKSFDGLYTSDENKSSTFDYQLSTIIDELKSIFDGIEAGTYALKGNDKRAVIKLLLDDYFFDYWLIEYKNDRLGEMSTGKASFVILMLIVGLSKSKAPILIDQPEDNLDNRSITTELVTYLRNKKTERQIILVTHNPNVVVNADAENVIVANQKNQNDIASSSPYLFDYINGALENSFEKLKSERDLLKSMGIREHIAEVVEGGKEAFQKREEKYGFR